MSAAKEHVLPLVGVPRKQLEELAAALSQERLGDVFFRILLEGGFHSTVLARADLVEDLVARGLPELLPDASPADVETWREVLIIALQLPPKAWEVACLSLRHKLWNAEVVSPVLRGLRDALYRPYRMPREAWREHLAAAREVEPDATARDIALAIQRKALAGLDQRARQNWVDTRLRELAPDASQEAIGRGMKAVRQREQTDGGLLDPRWGLPAVFDQARGKWSDMPGRPSEIDAVFERLAGMERPAASSAGAPILQDPAPADALLAGRLLAMSRDAARDTQRYDGSIGKYDTLANAVASALYFPGQLDGLRNAAASTAFAAETGLRWHAGLEGPGSVVAETTKGYVDQSAWMRRQSVPMTATAAAARLGVQPEATKGEITSAYRKLALQIHPDKSKDARAADRFREFTEARDMLNAAGKRGAHGHDNHPTVSRVVSGLDNLKQQQADTFLARQRTQGNDRGDTSPVPAAGRHVPDGAEQPESPIQPTMSSGNLSWPAPQARAGALTDEGPRWGQPGAAASMVPGAFGATAPVMPATSRPTAAPLSGNAAAGPGEPVLLSADALARRDVVEFMCDAFAEDLASLDRSQQKAYRETFGARARSFKALDDEMRSAVDVFEANQRATFTRILQNVFGRPLDPDTTYIHTKVLAVPERRNVGDMASDIYDTYAGSRSRRALREGEPVVSWQSQTLWEAVKNNYAYNRGDESWSESSFLSSSANPDADRFQSIDGVVFAPDVNEFIAAVRGFDLGQALRKTMSGQFDIPRFSSIARNALRDEFAFDALESLRDAANSGVDADRYRVLKDASEQGRITATPLQLRINGIGKEPGLLPALALEVARLPGVFVYFPQRPGGALRFYPDARAAHAALVSQFVEGDAASDAWLARQLPVGKRKAFLDAQKIRVEPQGLNWLARPLYNLFNPRHGVRPKQFQIRNAPDLSMPLDQARLAALKSRWSDIASHSATTTSEQDFAAFERGFNEVVNEFSRWMAVAGIPGNAGKAVAAVFAGTVAWDLVSGLIDLRTTDGSGLAEAMENILTLAAFSGMHAGVRRPGQAAMDVMTRTADLPLLSTMADGRREIFRPDWDAYAASANLPPPTAQADHEGLIASGTKQFVRLERNGVTRLLEVEPVAASGGARYRAVTGNAALRALHVVYDPVLERWMPSFDDITRLDDVALLQRMLPSAGTNAREAGMVLDIAGVGRVLLENIWDDTTMTPTWLAEAVHRVRAYKELEGLEAALKDSDGVAPPVADEVLARLLAVVTGRELKIYQDGRVVERTRPPGAHGRPIELARLDDNHFVPRDSLLRNQAVPGAFSMIDALVAADGTVGKAPEAHDPGNHARRRTLRTQLLAQVEKEGPALHAYLLQRRGLVPRDPAWDRDHFVAAPPADTVVTALRGTYPELTDYVARQLAGQPEIRRRVQAGGKDPGLDLLVARHVLHTRVQRAKETLHVGPATPEGEALALSAWTRLPEWPGELRVDVFEGSVGFGGKIVSSATMLGSYGAASASEEAGTVVRIVRTPDGRYAAVGGEGGSRGEILDELAGDQLALAVLQAMTDAQRRRLGIDIDRPDLLRQRGRELANVHEVDELKDWLDTKAAKARCKRAPGDTCGASTSSRLNTQAGWMPPETEIRAFRDEIVRFGPRALVLPQNMVKDLLVSMHFRGPADFVLFRSSMAAILQRGTAYRGLPDYAIRQLGDLEQRNFQSQVDNEPLNQALAEQAYDVIREAYERSDIKSSNKLYDSAVAGTSRADDTRARAAVASGMIREMRRHNTDAAPGGGWTGLTWRNMQRVKVAGVGNCGELASAVADVISLRGYRAEPWQLMDGDHVFTVVGVPPAESVAATTSGQAGGFAGDAWKALWVADPWLGIYCPAIEYAAVADLKLTLWEAQGKLVLARDATGHVTGIAPDAAYRNAFRGRMARSEAGGLVKLTRQRWHDNLRQARVPDASHAPYVPADDLALTRQSKSVEQNAELIRSRSGQSDLDSGPSLETIDRVVKDYALAHDGALPEVGDITEALRALEQQPEAMDWDLGGEGWKDMEALLNEDR